MDLALEGRSEALRVEDRSLNDEIGGGVLMPMTHLLEIGAKN